MTSMPQRAPLELGPMPVGTAMSVIDERVVRAPMERIFGYAVRVDEWPVHLPHYRYVRFRERARDGGGIVAMSAYRPLPGIAPFGWPTFWLSEMSVDARRPAIRFRHIGGITTGMDVEWTFAPVESGTRVRIVHVWNGPHWPLAGVFAAKNVIGPIFIHGIASRTLDGLGRAAEKSLARI